MNNRYRGSLRPIIPGGAGGISVASYNKIDPVNPATVYQSFKGPFVTNPTYSHGEELWIKLSQPKYLTSRDSFISILLNVPRDVPYFENQTAPEQPAPSTYYRGGVWAQLIFSDFNPSTLCFNNAPFYFGTDDDFIPRDAAGGTVDLTLPSQDILGMQLKSMPISTRYFAGMRYGEPTVAPADALTQMRTLGMSMGFHDVVGEDNTSNLRDTFAGAVPAPTTTAFKVGSQPDGYYNGWMVRVVDGSGPAIGETSTVSDYTSNIITLASAFTAAPVPLDTVMMLIPPIRGVRFFTYAAGSSDLMNPAAGTGQFPFFYWPGVDSINVKN